MAMQLMNGECKPRRLRSKVKRGQTLPYMFYCICLTTREGRVSLRGGSALLEYAVMHNDEADSLRAELRKQTDGGS